MVRHQRISVEIQELTVKIQHLNEKKIDACNRWCKYGTGKEGKGNFFNN